VSARKVVLLLLLLAAATAAFGQSVTITTTSPLPDGYLNLSYGIPPGFQGLQFTATTNPNPPTPPNITWNIVSAAGSNAPPGLSMTTGGFLSGSPTTAGDFSFQVHANWQGFTDTKTFTIHVTVPQVKVTTSSPIPDGFLNQQYSFALSASSNTPIGVTWSAPQGMPPGLFLSTAGLVFGTPTQGGNFSIPVTASLTGTEVTNTATIGLTIYAGQVSILTPAVLPVGSITQGYQVQLMANYAGVTWQLAGSSLPTGINLNTTTGVVSGGTSTPGTYKFAVQASLPGYLSGTTIFTLYVTNGPLTILETTLPIAIQNQRYQTSLTPQGGLAPFSWSLATNTLSLTIDPVTGIISGTPTVTPGSYPLTVILSDVTGTQFRAPYTLFVSGPLTITTTSLPNATVGLSYVQPATSQFPGQPVTLSATGGQPPYTWIALTTPGPLPPGLALGTDGVLRGTPTTNGVYPILVQVTDFGKRVAQATLSITVGANITLSIGPNTLPDGNPSVLYPPKAGGGVQLTAVGGTPPYVFAVNQANLPLGLSLSSSGLLSGTPVGPPQAPLGTSTFTVTVHDSSSVALPLTGQKTYTLNITLPLNISTTSIPNGTVGVAYPQTTIQVNGGQPPYNYTVASGTLPAGINLDSSAGTLTGKPTGPAQVSTFTILVQDAGGQSAQQQYSITVSAGTAPPVISNGDASGTVGTPFSVTLAATGGTSPYTFALTSGTPQAGLAFANGVLSGTPSAAGSAALTFSVTDAQKQTASKTINVIINLPPPPPVTLTTTSNSPAAQPTIALTLSSAYPVDINGTLTLTFQSSVGGNPTEVQFVTSSGASSTVNFTIPKGQLTAPTYQIATGTVAGTIAVTAKFVAAGVDVTPTPAPVQLIQIKPAAPVITKVTFTNTNGVVTVTVNGYSTTREVVSGDFVFSVSSGNTVTNGGDVSVPLTSAFTTWYGSTASNPFGGQFGLTIPFNVANGTSTQVTSVSVKLTNTVGTSAAASPQ
jgi:hypothetical protein